MTSLKPCDRAAPFIPEEVEFIQVCSLGFLIMRVLVHHNVQAITVDINGYSRGKMLPREKLEDLLENKEEIVNLVEVMGTDFEIPLSITELSGIYHVQRFH